MQETSTPSSSSTTTTTTTTSSPSSSSLSHFSLLSWNLHAPVGSPRAHGRLENFLKQVDLTSPTVIAVQEIYTGKLLLLSFHSALEFLASELELRGYEGRFSPHVEHRVGMNSGLATFVKRGLVEVTSYDEQSFAAEEAKHRHFQCLHLTMHRTKIALLNVHLDHSRAVKAKQLDQLRSVVDASSGRVIVCGDFTAAQRSIWDDGSTYRQTCLAFPALSDRFSSREWSSHHDTACYDHVFSNMFPHGSPMIIRGDTRGDQISDHHGLLCSFSLQYWVAPFTEKYADEICSLFESNLDDEWRQRGPEFMDVLKGYIAEVMDPVKGDMHNILAKYMDSGGFFWLIIDGEEKMAGMVGMEVMKGEGSLIGELRRMHLRPEYRGKRLGSWLVRGFLLQMAQALQLSQVFLTTMEHNVEAISFYRSLSFDITKTELLEHTTKTLVTMTLYYNGNSNEEQKKN